MSELLCVARSTYIDIGLNNTTKKRIGYPHVVGSPKNKYKGNRGKCGGPRGDREEKREGEGSEGRWEVEGEGEL